MVNKSASICAQATWKGSHHKQESSEVLQISYEDLVEYLHSNHSVYMQVGHSGLLPSLMST